jgi:hypothetical protein
MAYYDALVTEWASHKGETTMSVRELSNRADALGESK